MKIIIVLLSILFISCFGPSGDSCKHICGFQKINGNDIVTIETNVKTFTCDGSKCECICK